MEEIKDALQYIPLDDFEEVCKYSQTFLDESLDDYFNDYNLHYQTRKRISGYVDDWMVPVAIKDLADGKHIGASAIQGRDVYGCMVSRPATVLVKKKA